MPSLDPDLYRRARPVSRRRRRLGGGRIRLAMLLPVLVAIPLGIILIRHGPQRRAEVIPAREHFDGARDPGAGATVPEPVREESPASHLVVAGDTLSEIAEFYGCGVAALAAANGMDPRDRLLVGTRLRLPVAGEAPKPVVASVAPPVVREPVLTPVPDGGVPPVSGLQVQSPNYPSVFRPETAVPGEAPPGPVVPEEAGPVPGLVQPVSGLTVMTVPETTIQYLVQPGDAFERIAASHFTTVDSIKRLNRLELLAPGQVIEIPVDQCLTRRR